MIKWSKASSGIYFVDPRHAQRSLELGLAPARFGGGFKKLTHWLLQKAEPNDPPRLQKLLRIVGPDLQQPGWGARFLDGFMQSTRPQRADGVGMFHLGVSFDKSVSLYLALLPEKERSELVNEIAGAVWKRIEALLDNQVVRTGADGQRKEPSFGFAFGVADLVGAHGQSQFHFHVGVPNFTVADSKAMGAIGNARDSLLRAAPELNASIQHDVAEIFRSKGIKFELAKDGVHVRVAGFPEQLLQEQSPARQGILDRVAQSLHQSPLAWDYRAHESHRLALRKHPDAHSKTVEQVHREVTDACKKLSLTHEQFRHPPTASNAPRDAREERWWAQGAVKAAVKVLEGRGATISAEEFRAAVISQGIASPKAVRSETLSGAADAAMERPKSAGLLRIERGDQVLFSAPKARAAYERATEKFERKGRAEGKMRDSELAVVGTKKSKADRPAVERTDSTGEKSQETKTRSKSDRTALKHSAKPRSVKARRAHTDRADATGSKPRAANTDSTRAEREKGAKNRLREATGELKSAIKIKLIVTAAKVLEGIADRVAGKRPKVVIDGRRVEQFLARHTPGGYWSAQKAAWKAMLSAPGNRLSPGLAGQAAFFRVRHHARLPKRAEIVVKNGHSVSEKQLNRLLALALRDGAKRLTVYDRPRFDKLAARSQKASGRGKTSRGRGNPDRAQPKRERGRSE